MSNFINNLISGNLEDFRKNIFDSLYAKAGENLENRKAEIANNLYSEPVQQDSEDNQQEEE